MNEIVWKNTVETDRSQMIIRRMRNACWIPKATNTRSEYVILIAYPLQQWLHESTSMLRYTYTVLLNIFPDNTLTEVHCRSLTP